MLVAAVLGGCDASGGPSGRVHREAGDAATTSATTSATTRVSGDAGYPARPPWATRLVYRGGRIVRRPEIVTVTFAGDDPDRVERLERFGAVIVRGTWWRTVTEDLCARPGDCIQPGRARAAVRLKERAPEALTLDEEGQLLRRAIARGELPPPTADTVYVVYMPRGVRSGTFARVCEPHGQRGHHSTFATDAPIAGLSVGESFGVFAVVYACGSDDETTATASHEILEAVTDPIKQQGFVLDPAPELQVFTMFGAEIVDVCSLLTLDGHRTFADGFVVDRAYSSANAAAGRDPCVPAPARPYLSVVPASRSEIVATVDRPAIVPLTAIAEAPTPDFSLSAFDYGELEGKPKQLVLSFDRTTVNDGVDVSLTIRLLGPPRSAFTIVGVASTLGARTYVTPLQVATPPPTAGIDEPRSP